MSEIPPEILLLCQSVKAKRPKTVIDHILQYGFITTEQLKREYGYDHPPRAVRDVREHGIPIETFRVTNSNGKKIAAYRFGTLLPSNFTKSSGRTVFSKQLKSELISQFGSRCSIYLEQMDESDLQIDHRIPYEVAGDNSVQNPKDFMLLSGSANRAKSWSCEHCNNWKSQKDLEICRTCYWAYPENYTHIAMREVRRVDLLWQGSEVGDYENLKIAAEKVDQEIPRFIKEIIVQALAMIPLEKI
jgi:hypothetical protein